MEKSLSLDRMFQDLPFHERFARAAAEGFECIELGAWTDLDITRVSEELTKNNLRLTALLGSNGHDLSRTETHASFTEHVSQTIAVAKVFGCRKIILEIRTGSGQTSTPAELADTTVLAREDLRNAAIATRILMSVAQRGERNGMTFYLKPPRITAQNQDFLPILRLSGNVVGAVNSPALRLLLDSTQLWLNRDDPDAGQVMRRIRQFLGYVHVGEGVSKAEWPEELAWFRKNIVSYCEFDGNIGLLYPVGEGDEDVLREFRNL